jgi:hypothetical protein
VIVIPVRFERHQFFSGNAVAATESRPVEQRLEVGSSSEGVPFDVVATFEE